MRDFYKFPSTPYLLAPKGQLLRSDKVFTDSERNQFISNKIIIEEKIDGANLGISFDNNGNIMLQNRGSYICTPYAGQWKKLNEWLRQREDRLFDLLGSRYILFGEWCYASHTLKYEKLPDWFVGFDLYDKEKELFFSSNRRDQYFKKLQIFKVPTLGRGEFTLNELLQFLKKDSAFSKEKIEGIYLRYDDGAWLKKRAKLVRSEFVQSINEHWRKKVIKTNSLISFQRP